MGWIIAIILTVIFGPALVVKVAGYLIQKYKFGNSFKEVYEYHKECDRRERETR